jgi:hypothetical protein
MKPVYFLDACPELEELLERHFEHMRALLKQSPGVFDKIDALVLGGGYGRGEGGIVHGEEGSSKVALFNDLDYFLFTAHPNDPLIAEAIHALEAAGRDVLGIDVDIKCLALDEMGDPSESMMFSDLIAGHHIVYGPEDYLRSRFPEVDPARLPAIEASRLLWNRGTGLYFASCHIERQDDADFVTRNHAKFKLAAGDALLALEGQYASSCRERFVRFKAIRPDKALGLDLEDLHAEGVRFKLSPTGGKADWNELAAENRSLAQLWTRLFLHVESHRLGIHFESPADYVEGQEPRSPEIPRWKAPLFAIRDYLKYRRWLSPIWDYPRAALFRSLFCLLSEETLRASLPSPGHFLAPRSTGSEKRAQGLTTADWESVYTFWWQRYG